MNNTVLMKLTRTIDRLASRNWKIAVTFGLVATLAACGGDEMLPAGITGYNHMPRVTGWSIGGFSVDGHSGTNPQPETGGGKHSCCISLPRKWHPGMKVKVEWFYHHRARDPEAPPPLPQQAEVEVPEYTPENSGDIQVHFYPEHRVKVLVSRYGIRHPRYPMSEEDKKPWVTDRTLEQ